MDLNVPSLKQAETLLLEAEKLNPGPWVAHSRNVAQAAKLIAEHHPTLNAEVAYIFGLLHDIGRREGVTGMRHALDGYRFLDGLGYSDAARICLTHSFPYQSILTSSDWDVGEEDLEFVQNYINKITYDDYDKLLQLCDCLAVPQGFCLIETRIVDVALRYGVNEYSVRKWQAFMDLKTYFEDGIGASIYALLPGIVETTFGFKNA